MQTKPRTVIRALTYKPKIEAVRNGTCRQTIRINSKEKVGDILLLHGWSSRPYFSTWNWRMSVPVTEAIPITITKDTVFTKVVLNPIDEHDEWIDRRELGYRWTNLNELARLDGIDPPTGIELQNVLLKKNKKLFQENPYGVPAQVLRW